MQRWKNVDLLLSLAILICIAQPIYAQSSKTSNKIATPARTLDFKSNFSLGRLFVTSRLNEHGLLLDLNNVISTGDYIGPARGRVQRPAGVLLYLLPSYDLLQAPKILQNLPPDVFDCFAFGNTLVMAAVDDIIVPLSHLTGLKRLELNAGELTDEQLLRLKTLVNLQDLSLSGNALTGKGLQCLNGMKKLRWIDLSMNRLSHDSYRSIAACKTLEELHLNHCQVDDEAIKSLITLPNLRSLDIGQSIITSRSFAALKQVKTLEELEIVGAKVPAKDLLLLRGSSLRRLTISSAYIAENDLVMLKKTLAPTQLIIINHKGQVSGENKAIFAPLH